MASKYPDTPERVSKGNFEDRCLTMCHQIYDDGNLKKAVDILNNELFVDYTPIQCEIKDGVSDKTDYPTRKQWIKDTLMNADSLELKRDKVFKYIDMCDAQERESFMRRISAGNIKLIDPNKYTYISYERKYGVERGVAEFLKTYRPITKEGNEYRKTTNEDIYEIINREICDEFDTGNPKSFSRNKSTLRRGLDKYFNMNYNKDELQFADISKIVIDMVQLQHKSGEPSDKFSNCNFYRSGKRDYEILKEGLKEKKSRKARKREFLSNPKEKGEILKRYSTAFGSRNEQLGGRDF